MGSTGGGEKPRLHLKDKFFQTAKEVEMGAWGITVRQSDDGLDLLDTIVMEQLRKVEFAAFNVSEAITLLSAPVIKCQKTPRKKCRFVAERRKKR